MHKMGLVLLLPALLAASTPSASAKRDPSPAIAFERNGDLYTVSLAGQVRRLTYTPAWYESEPAVSPDGRTIAYSRERRGGIGGSGIWEMRTDATGHRLLLRGPSFSPAWRPDGYGFYFVRPFTNRFGDNCGSISRAATGGSPAVRVTRGPLQFDPAVSPSDGRLAFADADYCAGSAGVSIRVVDDAGHRTRDLNELKPARGSFWQPSWSPDGARITFSSPDGYGGVFVAMRDGSRLRRVVTRSMRSHEPAWSRDGRWIAFVGGPSADLYVVRPDGTGLRRLMRTIAAERSPSWLPAGG